MRKLLTSLAVVVTAACLASAAQADCNYHSVTAESDRQDSVAMSTYDGAVPPVVATETEKPAEAAAPECAEGDKDCAPATE